MSRFNELFSELSIREVYLIDSSGDFLLFDKINRAYLWSVRPAARKQELVEKSRHHKKENAATTSIDSELYEMIIENPELPGLLDKKMSIWMTLKKSFLKILEYTLVGRFGLGPNYHSLRTVRARERGRALCPSRLPLA